MKKRLLLITLMVALFVCLFVVSASAAVDIKRFATDEFQTGDNITYVDGITAPSSYDASLRVVLKNSDNTYTTYPAYYIYNGQTGNNFKLSFDTFNGILESNAAGEAYDKTSIIRVEVPAAAKLDFTFNGCSNLKEAYLQEGVTFNTAGFQSCSSLTTINIPRSATTFGQSTFAYCTSLERIEFPSTTTSLNNKIFQGCTSLKYVLLSENLTQIPHDFMSGCNSGATIVVSKNTTSIYSRYSLDNSGISKIIFTGTADSDFVASVQSTASGWVSKIEYANHCEYYYDNVHNAPYKYVFTSYLEECYTEGVCSRCGITNHGETYDAIVSFLGIAIKMDGTATTAGYALNDDSLAVYISEGYTFNYGVVGYIPTAEQGNSYSPLTIGENGVEAIDKQYTIHADISGEYASIDFIIKGFPQEAVSLIMCMYIYDGTDIVYICGTSASSYEQAGTAYAVTVDVANNTVVKTGAQE